MDRADVDQGYRYELLFGLAMSLLDELMRAHGGPAGVRLLNKSLASGAEWTECEQTTVEIIEATGPRRRAQGVVRHRDAEASTGAAWGVRAIRQAEAAITKIIATLDPGMTQAKSARHQYAANVRWHGGAAQAR